MDKFFSIISIFIISCSVGTDDFFEDCLFCGGAGGEFDSSSSSSSKNSTNSITVSISSNSSHSSSIGTGCQVQNCLEIAIKLNNNQVTMWDGSIPRACGVFEDGCGGFIECSEHSNDPTGDEFCGKGKWCGVGRMLDGGIQEEGIPGLCDGSCVFQKLCENSLKEQFICSGESKESPVNEYSPSYNDCTAVSNGNLSTEWCCSFSI